MTEKLFNRFGDKGIDCRAHIPLSTYSSFRIGGVGELGVFPSSAEELIFCISELRAAGLEYRIIGKGSNILFLDGVLSGAFIFTEKLCNISVEDTAIRAEAGASLAALSAKAAESSLCGLEFAKGIPGSVGGAVYMNAGAYGGQMSDVVISTLCYDTKSRELRTVTDHGFSYRRSIYEKDPTLVCLCANIRLERGDRDEIYEKMRSFAASRKEKQPLEYPSAGSYFKRPEGHFAGKLIEDCGLKGFSVGGAQVSEKHAGFIINRGGATAADVLELERKVSEIVFEKFGVRLEREVRVIG